jgi:hypothetical protein
LFLDFKFVRFSFNKLKTSVRLVGSNFGVAEYKYDLAPFPPKKGELFFKVPLLWRGAGAEGIPHLEEAWMSGGRREF